MTVLRSDAFDQTDAAVRQVMSEEEQAGAAQTAQAAAAQASAGPGLAARWARHLSALRAWPSQYKLKPRHLAWGVIAFFAVVTPWLIPILALFLLLVALVVYFSLGPDRVAELALGYLAWLDARDPERADRLRTGFATRMGQIDKLCQRLPEGLSDRISLPGTSPTIEHPKFQQDPFDRLGDDTQPTG